MSSTVPPQLALDAQVCFPLHVATRAVGRRYTTLLADVGLTYPQYLTMLALWEAEQPLTVGGLGERLHLDSGTLTPVLKRLEAAGLVVRRRDAADERRVLLEVTEAGVALQEQVADVPQRLWDSLGLDPEDAVRLRDILGRALEGLGEEPLP